MQRVNIIIVNWNAGMLLARCLTALGALPQREQDMVEEIVVVDNASTDSSLEEAAKVSVSGVRFLELSQNKGFAAANNAAAATLRGGGDIFLLNPDTEVRAGVLSALMRILREKPEVGIVGPKLVNPDGSLQPSVRPFPRFLDFVCYMLKLGRVVQRRQENAHDYSRAGYVDQVMGAAFLIRRETWEKVGKLDEGFFTLFEEVDFCKRARAAGWKTYFTPAGEVMHVRAASFSQLVGLAKTIPWIRSALRYAHKHIGFGAWFLLWAMLPATMLLTVPASVWHIILKTRNAKRS